jgi:hypothetical protein
MQGHGFRKDLVSMLADLKPTFIRFPGRVHLEKSLYLIILFLFLKLLFTRGMLCGGGEAMECI